MRLFLAVALVLSFAPIDAAPQSKPDTWTQTFDVAAADWIDRGRNPYFILEPGYALTLEHGGERLVITVLDDTRAIAGVTTRVVEERETNNGQPVEVSRNFYAIDRRTNSVFYFGEEVDMYKDGKVVAHDGAWTAGQDGARFGLMMPGLPLLGAKFYIDKFEVSNNDFNAFISGGGYVKKELWQYPFIKDGRVLAWSDAMKLFVDRSGLPGPRTWTGRVPDGKGDHPVADITWYEAAAYAAFRGKQLPTAFQWEKAARNGAVLGPVNYMPWGVFYPGDTLAHHANFEAGGTVPVASHEFGMSPFGAYNMAGNVAEWTSSDSTMGRLATGGAWGEPTYVFAQYLMLPGFYTSNKLGFRCVLNAPDTRGDQGGALIEVTQEIPKFAPTSDADFAMWRKAYDYDPAAPLDARIEEVIEAPEWRRERITFNGGGADGRRAIGYLYLPPKHFDRPLQVIHLVPGGDVTGGFRPLYAAMEDRLAPFIKSGRAAFGVVLPGYIERLRPPGFVRPDPDTVEYVESLAKRMIDLRRGLDYLATRRTELDTSRVAFFGPSAGAQTGLILAAIEDRYRTVVLIGAGVEKSYAGYKPAGNPANFASHIGAPKLMLHGLYDEDTPFKTMAEPLFALLTGTKKLVTYEGGHVPEDKTHFTVISTWLDETMGIVIRK